MKRVAALALLHLALAATAAADLTNPSTLTIRETAPSRFSVELTLPVVNGQIVKAKPVLPDICVADGEPEVRGDARQAIRTWTMSCAPSQLVGTPVGIQGLLGTAMNVLLTIETMDGRRHVQQLRATQAYFVIPPPPTVSQLALDAGRRGAERALRRPAMALLLLVAVLSGLPRRALLVALVANASAQALGQWLATERWMVMSGFLPQVAAASMAWLFAVELLGRPLLRPGWSRPLAGPMLVLGAMYGAAHPETVQALGLSTYEQRLSLVLFASGALAGLLLLTVCADQLRLALAGLADGARERWTHRVAYLSAVLAGGVLFYRASAPWFGGVVEPDVPLVTLVAAAAVGLWYRRDHHGSGPVLAVVAGACCATGLIVSLRDGALPLAPLAAFGLLALVGARMLLARPWPLWLTLSVVGLTTLYHGHHAGQILRHETTLPIAHAVGSGLLLAAVLGLCYRAIAAEAGTGRTSPPLRVTGLLAMVVAGLWQLAEYRAWANGPVATDLAMGLVRLPLLAMLLLLGAWLAWPRRRRFAAEVDSRAPGHHWALLGAGFFMLPIGTLRVDVPFHTPDAPDANEASRVMDALLTDTYLAFNLTDEDAAFDRLAHNLSQDLVADVYLDSRRRLTAGTREGAEVTVQDVSVMEVDAAIGTADNAFTYPCQWVVTARVRHLQHVHSRQNVYVGELTIEVEDDRWKIAGLELHSEERVVLSRMGS